MATNRNRHSQSANGQFSLSTVNKEQFVFVKLVEKFDLFGWFRLVFLLDDTFKRFLYVHQAGADSYV